MLAKLRRAFNHNVKKADIRPLGQCNYAMLSGARCRRCVLKSPEQLEPQSDETRFFLPPLGSKGCFHQADQALNSFQEISPPSSSQGYSTSSQARSEDTWHRLTYTTSLRACRAGRAARPTRDTLPADFPSVGCLTALALCEPRRDRVHDCCQPASSHMCRPFPCCTIRLPRPSSRIQRLLFANWSEEDFHSSSDVACASSSDAESRLLRTGMPESHASHF